MFDFLKRPIESHGTVLFRGTLPPGLQEMTQFDADGLEVDAIPAADGIAWAVRLRHPDWGEAEVHAPKEVDAPPRELLRPDPRLDSDDVDAIASCQCGLYLKTEGRKQNVLRDRKQFLRFGRLLMGDDGVVVLDLVSHRFWARHELDVELSHDADLDVEALFALHAVFEEPEDGGADDEEERNVYWLHTHGLGEVGCFDFDILRPHATFLDNSSDLTRAVAFAILQGRFKENGQAIQFVDPGNPMAGISADRFQREGPADEAALREDPGGDHTERRVVLCDPPGKRWFGLGKTPLRAARSLQKPLDEHSVMQFSNEASALMADRARRTFDLMQAYVEEFSEIPMQPAAKLSYQVDGGGEYDREHLWFEVHGHRDGQVDATLLNEPFNIAAMSAGDRRLHDLDRLTDWLIMTPVGTINPRECAGVRILRQHYDEIVQAVQATDG